MMDEDWSLDSDGNRKRFRRSVSLIGDGNDRDDRGWTLLHVGARKGDYKEVKRLLNKGMDAKSHGVTPLHLAAKGGHVKVMDKLLEHGANIDARTKGACGFENGAFLPDNIEDTRFNPPVHYCHGLEWAYDEMKRVQQESGSSSSGEGSYSSDS